MKLIGEILLELFRDLRGAGRMARNNKIVFLASGIAFFAIFSLFPVLIISFLASQLVLRRLSSVTETPDQLGSVIQGILPSLDPKLLMDVQNLLKANTTTNVINLFLLIWSAYELFRSLNYAFERISVKGKERSALWQNFLAVFCYLVAMGTLTFLLFVSTSDLSSLKNCLPAYFSSWSLGWFKVSLLFVSVTTVILGISTIFKIMPTEAIKWGHALLGSFLFVVLFGIGRLFFSVFGDHYRVVNQPFYGPFVTFIMVSMWIYYLSFVFLFCAQYSIYLEQSTRSKWH